MTVLDIVDRIQSQYERFKNKYVSCVAVVCGHWRTDTRRRKRRKTISTHRNTAERKRTKRHDPKYVRNVTGAIIIDLRGGRSARQCFAEHAVVGVDTHVSRDLHRLAHYGLRIHAGNIHQRSRCRYTHSHHHTLLAIGRTTYLGRNYRLNQPLQTNPMILRTSTLTTTYP